MYTELVSLADVQSIKLAFLLSFPIVLSTDPAEIFTSVQEFSTPTTRMDVVSEHKGLVSHILVARSSLQKASVTIS